MTEQEQVNRLAEQVLNNPMLLYQLSDRVYKLMLEEVQNQRDRLGYRRI